MSTVKIQPSDKDTLEKLQAKLRLRGEIKLDQYNILGLLIEFGNVNFEDFVSFIEGVKLTDDEIKELEKNFIKGYDDLHPNKSDDDLIYGE